MNIRSTKVATSLLLFTSFIWGAEFVPIDLAIELMPTNTFNGIRFLIATIAMLPLLFIYKRQQHDPVNYLHLVGAGLLLGLLLFGGFYTQTEGMRFTTVSNAGFITGLVVPLVPVMGFVFYRRIVSNTVWLGVFAATLGIYLLTVGDKLEFNKGDILVLMCAFSFAGHILLTDKFVDKLPIIPLSIVQLFAVALYSGLAVVFSSEPAFYYPENPVVSWDQQLFTPLMIFALLLSGVLGTAYAFWAQFAAQQLLAPHRVALIFATEPVFAFITAWLILDESLGIIGIGGAGLIICGMLISELGDKQRPITLNPLDKNSA